MKGETVVESHRACCSRKACCRKHIVNKKGKKKKPAALRSCLNCSTKPHASCSVLAVHNEVKKMLCTTVNEQVYKILLDAFCLEMSSNCEGSP